MQVRDGMWFPRIEAPANAVLQPTTFVSKNKEREALGMLYDLEKFHHYCFAHDISRIRDHKPLVAIFKKDIASLSHRLQRILL